MQKLKQMFVYEQNINIILLTEASLPFRQNIVDFAKFCVNKSFFARQKQLV
jgi:hypothetical protein